MLDGSREHSDAGAEKLVDPALDDPALDAPALDAPAQGAQVHLLALLAPRLAAVLCKPDAVPSAA